ncbi:hemolysin family protein [Bacillus thermotolerans]|uniref:hemolysin family protein n=1 Tax=Bacillus thermotolerans TaxID=1221996 RepID=UPI0005803E22|nr:hemolysin family protein [Bacillus thermotolerans]KKB38229.1 Magnesium and cobalt efflux protein CorC [Bacillus thermotolerans]
MDILNLVLIVILIAMTAFFVVSEFSIVKVRSSRIYQLDEEGHPKARSARLVLSNLDGYLSACQLGITMTALALGWIGEPAVAVLLKPLMQALAVPASLSHVIAVGAAFFIITFLHVVLGELAPKTLAIQKAESITLACARPLTVFYKVMYPFIWTLNGAARFITSLFGIPPAAKHEAAHTEEELRLILSESLKSGEINPSEFKYVNNIFKLDERVAKEIMVPRTEIVTLSKEITVQELVGIVKEQGFTRYPVIDGDKDHVIGIVNFKEVLTDYIKKKENTQLSIQPYIRPAIHVIDSVPLHELLLKLQKERSPMAVLMDEYGGTSGLLTIEDIIEEIVGDIQDEFDTDETPLIEKITEGHYIIDGKVLVDEVNSLLQLDLEDEDIDTIGGWILTHNFEAIQGDTIIHGGYIFTIKEMEDHQIKSVDIQIKRPVTLHTSLLPDKQPALPFSESKAMFEQ